MNSSFAPFAQILLLKNIPQSFLSLSVRPNNHPCTADDLKTEPALHIQKKNKMEVKIHQPRKKRGSEHCFALILKLLLFSVLLMSSTLKESIGGIV